MNWRSVEFRVPADITEHTAKWGWIDGNGSLENNVLIWHVFTIDGGRLIEVNKLLTKQDTENGIVTVASKTDSYDPLQIVLDSIRSANR